MNEVMKKKNIFKWFGRQKLKFVLKRKKVW